MKPSKTLILGIGNHLMSDDGVGGQAVLRLATETAGMTGVSCLDGGTLGYLLVGHIEGSDDLIVIDAAQLNAPPGTVQIFENDDMDRFLNTNANRSVHEVGLSDLLGMAYLGGHFPRRRALIAIKPQETDIGIKLSQPVSQSLPKVCEKVLDLMQRWKG